MSDATRPHGGGGRPVAVVRGRRERSRHPREMRVDDRLDVVASLHGAGIASVEVTAGREMLAELEHSDAEVVVVVHDGVFDLRRVCRDVRRAGGARILIVSATIDGDVEEHVAVLESGADDYLAGGAPPAVLVAHVRALRRALAPGPVTSRRIAVGDVELDVDSLVVRVAGEAVRCPPIPFGLMVLLADRLDTVVPRDVIVPALWRDPDAGSDGRRVRHVVGVARRVLGSGPRRPRIERVAGVGYRMLPPDGTS